MCIRDRFRFAFSAAVLEVVELFEAAGDGATQRVDVYLFCCVGKTPLAKRVKAGFVYQGNCELKASASAGGVARYAANDITPGHWVAVIDGSSLQEPVSLRYRDVIANESYGTMTLRTAATHLGFGGTTSLAVELTKRKPVPAGSTLVAVPQLRAGEAAYVWQKNNAANIIEIMKIGPPPRRMWPTVWWAVVAL